VPGHRPQLLLTPLARTAFAEFLGSTLLAAAVVGSGIAATQLTDDVALHLFINAAITGAASWR
jgi:hypothetical protein